MGGDIGGREPARGRVHVHHPAAGAWSATADAPSRRRQSAGDGRPRPARRHGPGHRRRPGHPRRARPVPRRRRGSGWRPRPTGRRGWPSPASSARWPITLDVVMPGMDGWAVLAALKADPDSADIPVVMLTMVDDRNKGFRARGGRLPDEAGRPRTGSTAILRRSTTADPAAPPGPGREDDDADLRRRLRGLLEKEGGRWTRRPTGARPWTGSRRRPVPDPARPAHAGDGRVRVPRRSCASGRRAGRSRSSS